MKTLLSLACAGAVALPANLTADIVVPGADGSDCDLTITENTVIDLSLATTAAWNASYAALAAGDPDRVAADYIHKGIYDPEKRAVIFRYTEVNIAEGATVTFINHPSRAPVVWLVSGDVNIAGTVSLNGQDAGAVNRVGPLVMRHAEPGPGGFRGGLSSHETRDPSLVRLFGGSGFGPGGGNTTPNGHLGFGGSFFTQNEGGGNDDGRPLLYGNPTLLPLIGGSGGAGDHAKIDGDFGGGGGGGAILIACALSVSLDGAIVANGGAGIYQRGPSSGGASSRDTGGGSGGGVRIVASEVSGDGVVRCVGGVEVDDGGLGRIRIETVSNSLSLDTIPTPSSELIVANNEASIWLPEEAPSAKLISLEGVAAPSDPRAGVDGENRGTDFIVGAVPTTEAIIETTNLPIDGIVQVRINPQTGGQYQLVDAVLESEISTDPLVLRWKADVPITNGYSVFQVRIAKP